VNNEKRKERKAQKGRGGRKQEATTSARRTGTDGKSVTVNSFIHKFINTL
jgi:hypothetical protein